MGDPRRSLIQILHSNSFPSCITEPLSSTPPLFIDLMRSQDDILDQFQGPHSVQNSLKAVLCLIGKQVWVEWVLFTGALFSDASLRDQKAQYFMLRLPSMYLMKANQLFT
jgi:hypothetical protein